MKKKNFVMAGIFAIFTILFIFLYAAHIECENFKRESALGKIWLSSVKKGHI